MVRHLHFLAIIIASLLSVTPGLFAEQVTIGTDNQLKSQPLASYYGYQRSAAIYKSEEIGGKNISINIVAWHSQIATTAAVPTRIYMKATTADRLYPSTWADMISGASLLYNQTHTGTVAGGWNTFTLNSGFSLGVGQNLIIMVERNFGGTGSGTAGGTEWDGPQIHASWGNQNDVHYTWKNNDSPPPGYNDGDSVFTRLRPNVRLGYTVNAPLDELVIGTGTVPSRFPLGSLLGYERSAALYTAAEIGTHSLSIATVAWYSTIAATAEVPTRIYLKSTTASSLALANTWADMISGASLLYNQTRTGTLAGGWNTYRFNSSFELAAGQNLLVLVERNYGGNGSYVGGDYNYSGQILASSCNNAHLIWVNDNVPPTGNADTMQPYRPNLKLSYTVIPEELAIGDGTSVQRFPLGSYYGYERSAALYTATEIGGQNIGISSVAWYATQGATAAVPTKIYLKRTSASTLVPSNWADMISDATLNYDDIRSGLVANSWNRFDLNSTFDLAMGDNLIVLVERNYGGGGSGGSGGGGIRSTLNYDTHLSWWADTHPPTGNNNGAPGFRPNLKLYHLNNLHIPTPLPFTENWSSGDLATNHWAKESYNWEVNPGSGGTAPSVSFNYSPHLADYHSALTSHEFDARGISSVEFSFDLYLNHDDVDVENIMSWQIWNGSTWITLGSYSSLDGNLPFTHYSYDISAHASNRIFKIRFVASGEQTFFINKWLINNIHLGAPSSSLDPVTNLVISVAGNSITLSWSPVPGASWYRIYDSPSPGGPFRPIGSISSEYVRVNLGGLVHSERFFTVTAGNGPPPVGQN